MEALRQAISGSLFYQFAAVLLVATIIGAISVRLKQPLIVSFIAVGILAGPAGLGIAEPGHQMELLAQMGIAALLFLVGLKLDLHLIKTLGPVALATGMGQVIFTSGIGFGIALLLGMSPTTSVYVAVALTFSSTIIIIKLLSDKREIDSLHGRIATGFLIVQDIVVVLVMILLNAFGVEGADPVYDVAMVFVRGLGFLAAIGLLMRFVLPRLLHSIAQSTELLVLFAIAWAFALASLGDYMGFSKEVGAFLAGVSLASTEFRESIGSRLVSLRDFLLLFFFIELGAQLDLALLGAQLGASLLFSAFVLIGNPIIVMVIMGAMGYRRRTGFMAGLTVAQISEFSLILAALGYSLGHITQETVGLITLVGLITIGISTYMILYSQPLYARLSRWLQIFERKTPHRELAAEDADEGEAPDVILFGLGRFGRNILEGLNKAGYRTLVVDFDPEVVRDCPKDLARVRYGDASDPELLSTLPLESPRWVVSTARERDVNAGLIHALRAAGFGGQIAVTSHSAAEAEWLKSKGADLVFLPYVDAGRDAARILEELVNP
jgi:Kef-type K+ transport system membrane component KefB